MDNAANTPSLPIDVSFMISDLREVIACQEDMNRAGLETPKLGQYWDELYALLERKATRTPYPPAQIAPVIERLYVAPSAEEDREAPTVRPAGR